MIGPAPWILAITVPLALGALALLLGWVRRSGFALGVPVGIFVLRAGGVQAFAILGSFFLLGTGLTRLGYARKAVRGVAEAMGGRRGAAHVAANCAVALSVLAIGLFVDGGVVSSGLLAAAYAGAFAAAASDTASSEVGQLYGRRTFSPWTWRPRAVGTPGAVSLEGTLAGAAAAAVIGLVAWGVGWVDLRGAWAAALGGFVGNWLESLAGAQGRRALPHGALNLANTAVGAGVAALLRGF